MTDSNFSIPFQKGHTLSFPCTGCLLPLAFSIFDLDRTDGLLCCSSCKRHFLFNDPQLRRQLRKFEALCRQIKDSEEILSNASIGIDLDSHHVKIPYKLLLTRFNSQIDLQIGEEKVKISFRIEPQHIP